MFQHAPTYERAAVTPYTFTTILLPALFSYYVMAVLVQLPRASLYRAAFLPVVFWSAFRASRALDFSWNHPGYAYFNHGLAVGARDWVGIHRLNSVSQLGMFTVAMRSMAWALAQSPHTRLPSRKSEKGIIDGNDGNIATGHDVSISSAMWNACDLATNFRGIGWKDPQKLHLSKRYFQVESRLMFVLLCLCRVTFLMLVFDVLRSIIQSSGPDTFATAKGGTIFDLSLPPAQRYMKSSTITVITGLAAYAIINAVYELHAALFTALFQQYPSQWPPLFDSPWLATSLANFWGRRWHQLFREPFLVLGSRLAGRNSGRAGVVMGASAVSGVLHEFGMRGMDRAVDTRPMIIFFLMQGIGVAMESAWTKVTGRRVCGVLGWLWASLWLLLWGQLCVDVWAKGGLLGSEFCPEAYRPTVLLLNWISSASS